MSTRTAAKGKTKKPLETTLGKAQLQSTDNPIDLSHVRKPIDTSIFGLTQVLALFETATDEVRRYVAYECDIMYECRMCRTIFRSLANFILHKRNYCRESYNQNDHTNCRNNCQENEFSVIQKETDAFLAQHSREQNSGTNSPVPSKCDSKVEAPLYSPDTDSNQLELKENKKNLNYVLRRLQGKQESVLITEQCLSEDVSNESKSSEKEETENNVALEMINDSNSGVFQTMFWDIKRDLMKTEVMEIHNILENNEAVIGSDGKIVTSESDESGNFSCSVCNQKFSTRKTLTYHIKYKHNNARLIYRCPDCNDTFANAWSVFRHLYKVHRKTIAQVKRLRNQIHANVIRRDEQPEPKESNGVKTTELTSNSQEKVDIENQQWMDDLEGDNDLQRCGGCGRKFERKAALHSHSQFCSKRIAICNSMKENSAKRVQAEEKQTKNSKIITATTENDITKGSRRRKPLVAQKMCRVDYIKENQAINENSQDKLSHSEVDQVSKDDTKSCKEVDNEVEVGVIEIPDDSNDSENNERNEGEVKKSDEVVSSDANFTTNVTTTIILEEPQLDSQNKRCSRSRSGSSDDVIYVNTIKLPATSLETVEYNKVEPTLNVTENTDLRVYSSTTKNNIITRSKGNVVSNLEETIATLSSKADTEVVSHNIMNTSEETAVSNSFDKNCSAIPEVVPEINCSNSQEAAINNKRKQNEFLSKSPPTNWKRRKNESTPEDKKTTTLETKSVKYIDNEKQICLPCKKTFKSRKSLLKHMAVHFNWYRYQCRCCTFMSYNKSKCSRHAEMKHGIHDEETLKNTVLHIPGWKSLEISTDFSKLCKKRKVEVMEVVEEEEDKSVNNSIQSNPEAHQTDLPEANVQEPAKSASPTKAETKGDSHSPVPDAQDPSVRKMILEVIFGSETSAPNQQQEKDASQTSLEETEVNGSLKTENAMKNPVDAQNSDSIGPSKVQNPLQRDNPRPVRNRTTTAQKDFLYDMAQILKPKIVKDKVVNSAGLAKEDLVKKQKSMKTYVKETKSKLKKPPPQFTIFSDKKANVDNKSVSPVPTESHVQLVQDINMNSKDVSKKHVTGDCG